MYINYSRAAVGLTATAFMIAVGSAQAADSAPEGTPIPNSNGASMAGYASLAPASNSKVTGSIAFDPIGNGQMKVTGVVKGLSPGKHGFHIHEFGDCTAADASSAGGHFAPKGMKHGDPADAEHHAGDLGNIMADEAGMATIDIPAAHLELSGSDSIAGRAIVAHAKADDLKSQPSGAAGDRVACGLIGIRAVSDKK